MTYHLRAIAQDTLDRAVRYFSETIFAEKKIFIGSSIHLVIFKMIVSDPAVDCNLYVSSQKLNAILTL